jgi:hypothetical protein
MWRAWARVGNVLHDYCLVPVELLRRYFVYTADAATARMALPTCERIVDDFMRMKDATGLIALRAADAAKGARQCLLFLDHPGIGWHPRTTVGIERGDYSAGINLFYLQALQALDYLQRRYGPDAA